MRACAHTHAPSRTSHDTFSPVLAYAHHAYAIAPEVEDEGEAERRDQTLKDLQVVITLTTITHAWASRDQPTQALWVSANELLEKCEGMERCCGWS